MGGATKQERFAELHSALQQAGFHTRSRIYTEVNTETGKLTILFIWQDLRGGKVKAIARVGRSQYPSRFGSIG